MKYLTSLFFCFYISLNIQAQEINLSELYEIVNCGQSCFLEIVKKHSYTRKDDIEGAGMSRNKYGRYLRYGPWEFSSNSENTTEIINSILFFYGSNRTMGIIYTDNKEYWISFYEIISESDKYYRSPSEEGSTQYDDWVYKRVGYPNYTFNFVSHKGNEHGDYSLSVAYKE